MEIPKKIGGVRILRVPTVIDRPWQRAATEVLNSIDEHDFLDCSFGRRPGRGTHHALAPRNEFIAGMRVSWVFEADLKNFFGTLDHQWTMTFVEHRVGDARMLTLIRYGGWKWACWRTAWCRTARKKSAKRIHQCSAQQYLPG